MSYFTIESNLAVLLASLAVVQRRPLDTTWARALRLASLIGITVTGIVYVIVLADDPIDRSLASSVANGMLHYLAPPLTVLTFLTVGPWPRLRLADIARVMIWTVVWGGWTALHGEWSDWYPYGFIDVNLHGYADVAVNFVGVVVFALVLGALFVGLDRWRGRGGASATPPGGSAA